MAYESMPGAKANLVTMLEEPPGVIRGRCKGEERGSYKTPLRTCRPHLTTDENTTWGPVWGGLGIIRLRLAAKARCDFLPGR
jgi:hypothetical protein